MVVDLRESFRCLTKEQKYDAYRALWRDTAGGKITTSYPLHLDLELTGRCNLKCHYCFQNDMIEGDLDDMPIELFQRLVSEGVEEGLCAIKLQVRGESLLHPRFFDCVRYAKDRGVLDVQVTTNGTLLSNRHAQSLLDCGLDGLIISYDEHHEDNFDAKTINHYARIGDRIHALLELREEQGCETPWIRIQASVNTEFLESLHKMRDALKRKFPKADHVAVSRIHNFGKGEYGYRNMLKLFDYDVCSYPFQRLAVFWNGDVTLCCMDYTADAKIGNVYEDSLEKLWLSDKMNEYRGYHLEGRRADFDLCKFCNVALKERKQLHSENSMRTPTAARIGLNIV